jgi:hypothetical protein
VGLHFARAFFEPGVVVVTSDPPGAEISLDGTPTGQRTPTVLENVALARPHQIGLHSASAKGVTVPVQARPGDLVARVHARLEVALGELTITSQPEGARVELDGKVVGRTPLTVPGVRLDERHRIDLTLDGHEYDQFVVTPEKDGTRFVRRLTPSTARSP